MAVTSNISSYGQEEIVLQIGICLMGLHRILASLFEGGGFAKGEDGGRE
jgi:hypothetical protein